MTYKIELDKHFPYLCTIKNIFCFLIALFFLGIELPYCFADDDEFYKDLKAFIAANDEAIKKDPPPPSSEDEIYDKSAAMLKEGFILSTVQPINIEETLPMTDYVDMPGVAKDGIPFSLKDAIAFMLQHQIALEISQLNIVAQEGNLRSSAGPFDYNVVASEMYTDEHNLLNGTMKSSKKGNETVTSFGATKETRIGTAFALTAQTEKINSPFSTPPTFNNGSITFLVTQPLLQGFLDGTSWMSEIAAEYELYATYFDNFQTVSQNLLNVVNSYWSAVAAQRSLVVQEEGIRRLDILARKIEKLIENEELSGDQIHQLDQQQIGNELALMSAEQTMYSSIQQLKLAMGDFSEFDPVDEPYDLTDKFPLPPLDKNTFERQFESYINYALTYRYDLQASTLRQLESYYLLRGAVNARLPVLNVTGQVTTSDFTLGEAGKPILSPLEMHKPQTNWTIGLSLAIPLYNDAAMGALESREAQYAQALLNTQLLQQQATAALRLALAQQIVLMVQLEEADEQVLISRRLYDESVIKLEAGLVSLFDLLSFENSVTTSLLTRIAIRAQYMQNIAQIRFLTSTMFRQADDGQLIEILDLGNLPDFCATTQPKLNVKISKRAAARAERMETRAFQRKCLQERLEVKNQAKAGTVNQNSAGPPIRAKID